METAPSAASPVEDSPGASAQRGIASVIARRESFGRSGASLAMPTEAAMTLDDATRDADTCAEMPSTPGYGCLADPSLAFIDSELSRCAPMQRLRGHSDFVVSVEPFNSDSSLFTAALDDCVRRCCSKLGPSSWSGRRTAPSRCRGTWPGGSSGCPYPCPRPCLHSSAGTHSSRGGDRTTRPKC